MREVVVGSCVLMLNTDDPEDMRNGFLGKVIGELWDVTTDQHTYTVRWFNGSEDEDIKPGWVAHV